MYLLQIPLFLLQSYIFFFHVATLPVSADNNINELEFQNALNQLFILESGAGPVSSSQYHVKLLKDLFYRQNIPLDISVLKNSTDGQIYKWLALASLSGFTSWKRDDFNKIILTNQATPIEPKKISNAEGDIFLCLVFSLLIYIAAVQFYQIIDDEKSATGTTPMNKAPVNLPQQQDSNLKTLKI